MPSMQGLRANFIYPYIRAADKDEAGSHHWTVGRISGRAFARCQVRKYNKTGGRET
jgi:hypothetical protein